MANAGLSEHHMYTFEDFDVLPDDVKDGKLDAARCCYELATDFIVIRDGVPKAGVFLHGLYGVGKTTIATSGCIEAARNGKTIMRVKHADFLDKAQSGYKPKEGELDFDEIMKIACSSPFLLVDDLGVPPRPGQGLGQLTDDKIRITHRLLEYRLEYNLPTLITSNLNIDAVKYQFGERTGERVRELCHAVEVTGANLRR